MYNFMIRVIVRGGYTIISTFVACLLPFFGDFISLTGSLCMMPLDLVLVLALFVKVSFENPIPSPSLYQQAAKALFY